MSKSSSRRWAELWWVVLRKPSLETFQTLLEEPDISAERAFSWIFVSSLVGKVIFTVFSVIIEGQSNFLTILWQVIFYVFRAEIGFILFTGLAYLCATLFNGEGNFEDLAFAFAAIQSPIVIIWGTVRWIPYVNFIVGLILLIYYITLGIMATKIAHQFSWDKAVFCYLLPYVAVLPCLFCSLHLFINKSS